MTRRPRRVSGAAATGISGLPLMPTVLFADADEVAQAMVRDALLEGTGPCDLRVVSDAGQLDDYLHSRGPYDDPVTAPRPSLILVDGDLPNGGALDAVRTIKSNSRLRRIPVVVLARRLDPETVAAAYDAGANTMIAKPVTFLALVKLMKVFTAYWLDAAALPQEAA
jgi:chemotaxis family two-component system response regulator Rcp1